MASGDKFCWSCGSSLFGNDKFCRECGVDLEQREPVAGETQGKPTPPKEQKARTRRAIPKEFESDTGIVRIPANAVTGPGIVIAVNEWFSSYPPTIKRGFQWYFDFKGRATRTEFSLWMLLHFACWVISFTAAFAGDGVAEILAFSILITLIPTWAVTVRRLRDSYNSYWWLLPTPSLYFLWWITTGIPVIGIIVLTVCYGAIFIMYMLCFFEPTVPPIEVQRRKSVAIDEDINETKEKITEIKKSLKEIKEDHWRKDSWIIELEELELKLVSLKENKTLLRKDNPDLDQWIAKAKALEAAEEAQWGSLEEGNREILRNIEESSFSWGELFKNPLIWVFFLTCFLIMAIVIWQIFLEI